MGKAEIGQRIKLPSKKTAVRLTIVLLAAVAVAAGAFYLLKGDDKVEFKVLGDTEIPQQITSQVIPEYRQLERALACVVDDKVYVLASRGEKPTSGYEIRIAKMAISKEKDVTTLTVYAQFKDPQPAAALTQALTYPMQVVETDLSYLPDQIELKVQYVE